MHVGHGNCISQIDFVARVWCRSRWIGSRWYKWKRQHRKRGRRAREERPIARHEGGWKGRETELGIGTGRRVSGRGVRASGNTVKRIWGSVGSGESLNQLDLNRWIRIERARIRVPPLPVGACVCAYVYDLALRIGGNDGGGDGPASLPTAVWTAGNFLRVRRF